LIEEAATDDGLSRRLGRGSGVQIAVTRDEPGLFAKGIIRVRVFVSCDTVLTTPAASNVASSVL